MANGVPQGMHTLTTQLGIDGADKAIEWFKQAFGAELLSRAADPSGRKVWHASLRIGDSVVFVNDLFPEMGPSGPTTAALWIYGQDVDAKFKRAVDAGAKVVMPLADMFWGDRMGTVMDPFGNRWSIAQRMKELTPDQLKQAQDAFVASMAQQKK